jgi:hypothetical protein
MPENESEPPEMHLPREAEDSVGREGVAVYVDLVAIAVEFAALSRAASRGQLDEMAARRWEALRRTLIRLGYEKELNEIKRV